jgi:hypothetical protein
MLRVKIKKWLRVLVFFGTCAALWIGISHSCASVDESLPPYGEPDSDEPDSAEP